MNTLTGDTQHTEELSVPVFSRWLGSWRLQLQRRPHSAGTLRTLYDHRASDWQAMLQRLDYAAAYETLMRHLLEKFAPTLQGDELCALECGVGTGELTLALNRSTSKPLSIDAIDLSTAMLKEAEQRFNDAGLTARLREANAQSLPYATNTFDVSMCAHLLEHMADPAPALAEMVRVTRPGGVVFASLTRRSLRGFLIHVNWRNHILSEREASNLMTNAGLKDIVVLSPRRSSPFARRSIAIAGVKSVH